MKIVIAEKRNLPIDIHICIEHDVLTYHIVNANGETKEAQKIELANLRNAPDFSDHAAYNFYDKDSMSGAPEWFQPFNLFAHTLSTKATGPFFSKFYFGHGMPLFSIMVPFKDSLIEDWVVGVNAESADRVHVPVDQVVEVFPGLDVARHLLLPKVAFKTQKVDCANGDFVDLEFSLVNEEGTPFPFSGEAEVCLEATGGAVSNTRVQTVNQQGKVRFFASNVVEGDNIKIKCGFKYFSGTDDCFVRIG